MKVVTNRMKRPDIIKDFSSKLSNVFQMLAEDLLIELTIASKEKLNRTINGTNPRGSRNESGQFGFENANVSVLLSNVTNTGRGARVQLRVAVTDGLSTKPHYIWHLINKGFQSGASASVRRFPVRNRNRTHVRNLDTSSFDGYSGEWRTIRAGERPAPVAPREWYSLALEQIDNEIIDKYGMIFTFTKKQANDE